MKMALQMHYVHYGASKKDSFMKSINILKIVNKACSDGRGQCSTFCFPTPSGGICGCQDNVSLLPNNKTCVGGSHNSVIVQSIDLILSYR